MRATLLALALAGPAAAQPVVVAEPPRMHGWWIGDELVHRLRVTLPAGWRLDPASLPRPRPVLYWLDLHAVEVIEAEGGVVIETRWRTFYSPLEPSVRAVPPLGLRALGPDGPLALEAPGWRFVTSPLRPILAPTAREELPPDDAFRGVDARPAGRRATAWALLASLGLGGLAWTQGWPPFHRRAALPLAAAARAVRRAAAPDAAALALHRGLDAAHGRALLGDDVGAFLRRRPEFAPLGPQLAAFFDLSAALFFDDRPAPPDARATIDALAADLAAVERGRR